MSTQPTPAEMWDARHELVKPQAAGSAPPPVPDAVPNPQPDAVPQAGTAARILMLPLLPFVLIWEAARALWTRGLPALGRLLGRTLSALLAPFRLTWRVLRTAAAAAAAAAAAVGRVIGRALRPVCAALVGLVRAAWRGMRPGLVRLSLAIRGAARGILAAVRVAARFVANVAQRTWLAMHGAARALAHGIRTVLTAVGAVVKRLVLPLWLGVKTLGVAARAVGRRVAVAVRGTGRFIVAVTAPLRRTVRALLALVRHAVARAVALLADVLDVAGRMIRTVLDRLRSGVTRVWRVLLAVGDGLRRAASAVVRPVVAALDRVLAVGGRPVLWVFRVLRGAAGRGLALSRRAAAVVVALIAKAVRRTRTALRAVGASLRRAADRAGTWTAPARHSIRRSLKDLSRSMRAALPGRRTATSLPRTPKAEDDPVGRMAATSTEASR